MKSYKYVHTILLLVLGTLLMSCDNLEEKYEKHLGRGDSYYEKQDYIKARLEYKNAAKILPTDPRAIYSLGLVEEAEGSLQKALAAFWVTEQQNPDFKPVLLKLAELYLTAQQSKEARTRIDKLLKLEPDHVGAHALMGSIFLEEKNFPQAHKEVKFVLQKDPSNMVAYSVLTGIYVAKKRPNKALEILEKAIALHPKEKSFYLLKAMLYSEQNDIAAVARTYRKIFMLYPEQIRFRFDLARIFEKVEQTDNAGKVYEETVRVFPKNQEAKQKLAMFLENEKGMDAAERKIHTFIEAEPNQKLFYLWLAGLYVRNEQDERAIATLKNIIKDAPDDWIGLNAATTLAEIGLSKGDIELTEKLIGTVLNKDVNNREALLLQANLAFFQKDYQKAAVDLRVILRDEPGAIKASRTLAEIFSIQKRNDLAIDTLLLAVQKHPGDKGIQVRLAQFYALTNNRDKAMELLSTVTNTAPEYPIGWETLARLAIENGQWAQAHNAASKLNKLEGQRNTATFLKGQISEKTGQIQEAIALYKDVIKADPSSPLTVHALSALLKTSQTPEQLKAFRDFLITIEPQNFTLLTVLGATESALGDSEAAKTAFKTAINQNPRNQEPYIALAKILVQQGTPEGAIDILKKAQTDIPSETEASIMHAGLLIKNERIDEAIALFEAILKRNERLDNAANNLAQTIADFKYDDETALERARLVAERFINSENPYYLDTLGWVYFQQGHIPQAQSILSKAISLLKAPNPQIDYHYGAMLFKTGQKEDARTYLNRAVSGPQYPGFDKAQTLLKEVD